jgi:hypothetical protein
MTRFVTAAVAAAGIFSASHAYAQEATPGPGSVVVTVTCPLHPIRG